MLKGVKRSTVEETKQATEADSYMTSILELSYRKFKITMIYMLKSLMQKVDNMKGQMDNVSRENKTLIKSRMKC